MLLRKKTIKQTQVSMRTVSVKYLVPAMALCLMLAGFTSCSDDDDDYSSSQLVGTWISTSYIHQSYEDGELVDEEEYSSSYIKWIFQEDGTAYLYYWSGDEWEYDGTDEYAIKGSKLVFYEDDDSEDWAPTIKTLTSTSLVVELDVTYTEDDPEDPDFGVTYREYEYIEFTKDND